MKQISVNFDEYSLVAFLSSHDDKHMVAIKPICDALGIDPRRQQKKLQSDLKFSWGHMSSTGTDGKQYQMVCIPVDEVAGFLYGINSRKVAEEVAPRLLSFQRRLQTVMHEAVTGRVTKEVVDELRAENRELRQALANQAYAIANLTQVVEELRDGSHHMNSIEASYAGKRLRAHRSLKLVQ